MIDASIPLQFKNPHIISPGELLSLKDLQTRSQLNQVQLEEVQRQNQSGISLRDLFSRPGMIDESGNPTAQGLSGVYGIDPMAGMKMSQQVQTGNMQRMMMQGQGIQQQLQGAQLDELRDKAISSVKNNALSAHDLVKQGGGSDTDARKAYDAAWLNRVDELNTNGTWTQLGTKPEGINHLRTNILPPEQARSSVMNLKDVTAQTEKKISDTRAMETETIKNMRAAGIVEGSPEWKRRLRDKLDRQEYPTAWMELNRRGGFGPGNGLTGEALLSSLPAHESALVKSVVEGKIDPKSLSMMGGHRERILGLAAQYDPNYNQQSYQQVNRAVTDFNTGKQGQAVRSFNVALEHMDTMRQLVSALNNGNVQAVNKFANLWKTQTGQEGPTDFNAAKNILSGEVVKAIVGAGGGVTDREEAAKTFNAANSPQQLLGVIETYSHLFGGQLKGLEQQYIASTKRDDFRSRLLTEHGRKAASMYEKQTDPVSGATVRPMTGTGDVKSLQFSDPDKEKRYQEWKRQYGK